MQQFSRPLHLLQRFSDFTTEGPEYEKISTLTLNLSNKISQNDNLKIVNPKTGTLANSEDPDSASCGISPGSALVGKTTCDQSSKKIQYFFWETITYNV